MSEAEVETVCISALSAPTRSSGIIEWRVIVDRVGEAAAGIMSSKAERRPPMSSLI